MTTQELSAKAISIMETVDFWRYVGGDCTCYGGHARNAEEAMKLFVKVTNEIGGELRQAFREAWIARYDWARLNLPGVTSDAEKRARSVYAEKLAKLREMAA